MNTLLNLRDVLLTPNDNTVLVTAVDSCGGIGMLTQDILKTSPQIVGSYTARVSLMEVLCTGAKPLFATLAVSNAPDYAQQILQGVQSVIGSELPCAISTEKNMSTCMTGVGISITGSCKKNDLKLGLATHGDLLYCLGTPLVGAETLAPDAMMISAQMIEALLRNQYVHTLIPVGSHGVLSEAQLLAKESALTASMHEHCSLDLIKSAGPSSCAVFAADKNFNPELFPFRTTLIGHLHA